MSRRSVRTATDQPDCRPSMNTPPVRSNTRDAILRDDEQDLSNRTCCLSDLVHSRHLGLSRSRFPAFRVASATVAKPHRGNVLVCFAFSHLHPQNLCAPPCIACGYKVSTPNSAS